MTTILAIVGDTHINSTVGLCVPICNLDDGGTYHSSKGQRWLWKNWLDFWGSVAEIRSSCKDKTNIWTIFNGDLVEGDGKRRTSQLITQNDATVMRIAVETLKPALDISSKVFVIRGTAAHVGLSANLEERVAIDIGAVKCSETDTYSWWQLLLDCEGVLFDVSHHGNLGRLPWTRSNALNSLAVRLILDNVNNKLPQVAVRSHNHEFSETGENYPIRVISLPAWRLSTEYSYRLGIFELADIGGSVFVCNGGNYDVSIRRYKPDRQRPWRDNGK